MQPFGSPLTETGGNDRADAITYRNNHVKIIIGYFTSYFSIALLTNLSEFPTSCFFVQFFILIDVLDMLYHIGS